MDKNIGTIKWFRDELKNANYGFIHHAILGDLFFHEKNLIDVQDINSLKEGEVVIFISQESQKYPDKLEAINVTLLENEKDIVFLFSNTIESMKNSFSIASLGKIQKSVYSTLKEIITHKNNEKLPDNLVLTFKNEVIKFLKKYDSHELNSLKGILEITKDIFPVHYQEIENIIESHVDIENRFNLWIDGFIEKSESKYIIDNLLTFTTSLQTRVINKFSIKDKKIIFKHVAENINNDDINLIKKYISLSKRFFDNDVNKDCVDKLIGGCSIYYKLVLWLEDYHQELDFRQYKKFIVVLSPNDQKKFIKKTLKNIHEGNLEISIDELTSINTITYENSKLFDDSDNHRLDYSTSIILNTISEMNKQNVIDTRQQQRVATYRMFDLILNQIKEPKEILEITGYFDECGGRTRVDINDNREIYLFLDKYNKPNLHNICDGRKNVKNGKPILCDRTGLEFWWCANQLCYKPFRKEHTPEEWEKYSLLDFLKILNVDFKEADYEIYLSLINKANRFLKHLKCRKCDHILRPIRQSNYAFYGVNNFHCTTENCLEKGKSIYLTHCLNGRCGHEIDSRDAVRCRPEGIDSERYGWYVCNYCNSCCSSHAIDMRKSNLSKRGQEYHGHEKGHKEAGIISCDKCGESMSTVKSNSSNFNEVLNWFITNKDTSPYIKKYGVNKFDKKWFIFYQNNMPDDLYSSKLKKYLSFGFQIPDINKKKQSQLISEPINFTEHNNNILVCESCVNIIDLSNDHEKSTAIKYFHDEFFKIKNK